jgi:pyruvate/2-oxoglutarate dehydrogenase complex dihydrolipoamide dehydrogenase (E3) component
VFAPAANRDRTVLVIGAGPAGMECAIVLGKRGASVRSSLPLWGTCRTGTLRA